MPSVDTTNQDLNVWGSGLTLNYRYMINKPNREWNWSADKADKVEKEMEKLYSDMVDAAKDLDATMSSFLDMLGEWERLFQFTPLRNAERLSNMSMYTWERPESQFLDLSLAEQQSLWAGEDGGFYSQGYTGGKATFLTYVRALFAYIKPQFKDAFKDPIDQKKTDEEGPYSDMVDLVV